MISLKYCKKLDKDFVIIRVNKCGGGGGKVEEPALLSCSYGCIRATGNRERLFNSHRNLSPVFFKKQQPGNRRRFFKLEQCLFITSVYNTFIL